jgi:O-antigen/teichoic acid export membrane protein
VTLISSIFDLGLDNAMIRYIAIYRSRKRQTNSIRSLVIFCTSLVGITGILGALLVLVMAPFLAKLVHKPDAAPLLQIMAPLIPLLCMQTVWTGGLQGLKEFKKRVFIQRFLVPLLLLLLMIVALIFFRNTAGVAALALLSAMISALINLNFLFRAVSRISDPGDEKYEVRTWLSFALPNFLTTIVNTMLDSIDTLLLAFFVSNAQIGQYTAAIKISLFILLPLTSLNIVFTPTIAELYARKAHQKLASMFKVVTKWTITFSLPIFGTVTLFSVPLLELSGKSFTAAWPLLIALATGYMISAATGSVGYMLLMTGHQKFSLFNSVATIILNIVLGIILTPRYGAMGTAISTGLAISVINGIRLLEVYLVLKMFPYRWDVLKPLGAGFISALLTGVLLYLLNLTHYTLQLFHLHLSIQLALVPVFLISYALLLTLFKINPEDKIVLGKLGTKFGRGKK